MKRNLLIGATFVVAIIGLVRHRTRPRTDGRRHRRRARQVPIFEVDPFWPKTMPNNWVFGQTIGLGIDEKDQVWIIHRGNDPGNLDGTESHPPRAGPGAANPGGRVATTRPAPLESANAAIRRRRSSPSIRPATSCTAGAGRSLHPDWPDSNHGIIVDHKGIVWIGGNGGPDAHILKFTREGKFVGMFGKKGARMVDGKAVAEQQRHGQLRPRRQGLHRPEGQRGVRRRRLLQQARGRDRHGLAARSSATGARTATSRTTRRSAATIRRRRSRSSSARRCTAPSSPTTASCTSATARTIASRSSRRKESSSRRSSSSPRRCPTDRCGTSRSRATRKQRFLYVADGANEHVYIVDRNSLEIVSQFGTGGRQPGQFRGVHSIAVDSKGNIYTTETYTGKRLQKFVFKGMGRAAAGRAVADEDGRIAVGAGRAGRAGRVW